MEQLSSLGLFGPEKVRMRGGLTALQPLTALQQR